MRAVYEAIPLELNAYTLEDRFRRDPRRGFSVQKEVAKWAAEGRLGTPEEIRLAARDFSNEVLERLEALDKNSFPILTT
jgi:hypothetical protein